MGDIFRSRPVLQLTVDAVATAVCAVVSTVVVSSDLGNSSAPGNKRLHTITRPHRLASAQRQTGPQKRKNNNKKKKKSKSKANTPLTRRCTLTDILIAKMHMRTCTTLKCVHPMFVCATLCLYVPPYVCMCHPMFVCATLCLYVLPYVCMCHPMFVCATLCLYVPPYVCMCHPMFVCATLCLYVPPYPLNHLCGRVATTCAPACTRKYVAFSAVGTRCGGGLVIAALLTSSVPEQVGHIAPTCSTSVKTTASGSSDVRPVSSVSGVAHAMQVYTDTGLWDHYGMPSALRCCLGVT